MPDTVMATLDMPTMDTTDILMDIMDTTATTTARDPLMLSQLPPLRLMLMLTTDTVMVILDMLTTDTTDIPMPTTVTTATTTARDPLMLSPRPLLRLMLTTAMDPPTITDMLTTDTTDIPMATTVTTATIINLFDYLLRVEDCCEFLFVKLVT